MTKVRYLHVYEDLFFVGKNFGKKIEPHRIQGLELHWDDKHKWFQMNWNGRTGWIFPTNCAFWEAEDGTDMKEPINKTHPQDINKITEAQVSTPHGYVFEGKGKGKTGVGKGLAG